MASKMHEKLPLNSCKIYTLSHNEVTNLQNFMKRVINMYHHNLGLHIKFVNRLCHLVVMTFLSALPWSRKTSGIWKIFPVMEVFRDFADLSGKFEK